VRNGTVISSHTIMNLNIVIKEHLLMMTLAHLSLNISFLSQKLIVLDQVLLQHPTGRPRVLHLIQQPDPLHRRAPGQGHVIGHWRGEKKQMGEKEF